MKAIILFLAITATVFALDNGLGLTPQMGFNTWNHFGCNIDENLAKATADALVSLNLSAKGYQYVNLDDCWQVDRKPDGTIIEDPTKFPSGMKALADYMHSKGLKFGLYSDAGYKTCAGRPGSLGHETIDAQTYASWGVDYLKYDNCNTDGTSPKVRYPVMRDALNKTGHQIFFSMCEWGVENPWEWSMEVGNSWRTTGDISDNWNSFTSILDQQVGLEKYSGKGGWNDPDMLEVGNGGMTTSEYQAHFALWCLLKAPLLIGCDLTKISQEDLTILSNDEIIAISQDPLGQQGKRISKNGDLEVWAGPLADGSVATILFNRGSSSAQITANFNDVGLQSASAQVRDLINHSDLGHFSNSFSTNVDSHSVVVVKMTPTSHKFLTDE